MLDIHLQLQKYFNVKYVCECRLRRVFLCEFSSFHFAICTAPEFIDPVLTKKSQKRSFSVIENSVLGLFSRELGL
jgi:hypothetical protein